MQSIAKVFIKDEEGAVTVDWVVLTAAIVALVIVFYIGIHQSTTDVRNSIATKIDEQDVGGY